MSLVYAPADYASLERYLSMTMALDDGPPRSGRGQEPEGVPYAYALWLRHLGKLAQLSGVVQLGPERLTPEQARGLAILRRAREKYRSEHERCGGCGQVKRAGSFCKNGCGSKQG